MKKRKLIILSALLISFSSISIPSFASEDFKVDLAQAKKYVVSHNFGIQAISKELEASRSDGPIARSKLFPKLSLSGGGELEQGENGSNLSASAYIGADWNLFRGFSDSKTVQIEELNADLKEIDLKKNIFQTEVEVERLYYQYLFQEQMHQVYRQALELNQKHLQSVKVRRSAGMVSDSDIMDFSLRDSLLASSIVNIQSEQKGTQLALVRILGPNLGTHVVPNGTLPHFHLKGNADEYLRGLEKKNFNLQELLIEREQVQLSSDRAKGGWLPRIDLTSRAGLLPRDERTRAGAIDARIGLGATWELFSGLETVHEIKKSSARAEAIDLKVKQQIVSSMSTIESTFHRLKAIETRFDLEKPNLVNAEKLYKAIWSEYGRGIKTSGDVKAAEQALLDARLQQENLKWQAIGHKLDLEMELGELANLELHSVESKKE